jgi:hypothetical protein
MEYFFFAERYHWPPPVVDDCPADFVDLAPEMAIARDRAQAIMQERAQRRASRGR